MNNNRIIVLLSTFLFVILSLPSSAYAASVPQWSDFCPEEYLNASQVKTDKEQSYWYWRRLQFEQAMDDCNGYTGEALTFCYEKVKKAEDRKNSKSSVYSNPKYEARERAREQVGAYGNFPQPYIGVASMIGSMLEDEL